MSANMGFSVLHLLSIAQSQVCVCEREKEGGRKTFAKVLRDLEWHGKASGYDNSCTPKQGVENMGAIAVAIMKRRCWPSTFPSFVFKRAQMPKAIKLCTDGSKGSVQGEELEQNLSLVAL